MNNMIEMRKNDWKGYTQTVTIGGAEVEYSLEDLHHEAERHTHLRSSEKGISTFLPSVNRSAVLRDLVKLRGITADTLFKWLTAYMKSVSEYGDESWQEVKKDCESDFYAALTELDELKELFYGAINNYHVKE